MRKRLLITLLLFIVLIISCFAGCAEDNKDYFKHKPEYGPQFMLLESYNDPYLGRTYILVDKNSRVMYLLIDYDTNKTDSKALAVLYDSEGNVRRYSGTFVD